MIIHNNYAGLAIYMCHSHEKYDAVFKEYMDSEIRGDSTFWSEAEKRHLWIAHEQWMISDLYSMKEINATVMEVGEYSLAVNSKWFTVYKHPEKIGLVIDDHKLMLATHFIINDNIAILYFDEHVENLSPSDPVRLCCVIQRNYV